MSADVSVTFHNKIKRADCLFTGSAAVGLLKKSSDIVSVKLTLKTVITIAVFSVTLPSQTELSSAASPGV